MGSDKPIYKTTFEGRTEVDADQLLALPEVKETMRDVSNTLADHQRAHKALGNAQEVAARPLSLCTDGQPHLYPGDHHGLPIGNCQKCGLPLSEWMYPNGMPSVTWTVPTLEITDALVEAAAEAMYEAWRIEQRYPYILSIWGKYLRAEDQEIWKRIARAALEVAQRWGRK